MALAANVAHGWPDGPIEATVAAWPAASLVGSYELLLWLVRSRRRQRDQRPDDGPGGGAHRPRRNLD